MNFPFLFVKDWVYKFDIFPLNFKYVYVNEIVNYSENLLHDLSDLFTDKVGEIKGLKAELYLAKDAMLIFCKTKAVTQLRITNVRRRRYY